MKSIKAYKINKSCVCWFQGLGTKARHSLDKEEAPETWPHSAPSPALLQE